MNALAPDITWTEGLASVAPNPEGMQERFGQTVPMGRAGHVDEMAGAAIFLASSLSVTSRGRRSTSTVGLRPPVAGTTTPKPASTSSGRPSHSIEASSGPTNGSSGLDHFGRLSPAPAWAPSAVDGDQLSRDVARLVGGEERRPRRPRRRAAHRRRQDGPTEGLDRCRRSGAPGPRR